MWWSSYKKRLTRDLDHWRDKGWLSDESRAAIIADVASSGREFNLASALAILASVLFGFAAISFVAAHWQDMPRLARLGMLLAALWAGYGASGWLARRGHEALADAASLFAVARFRANIMLLTQLYALN